MDQNIFINGSRIYWGFPFYSTAAIFAETAANAYDWMCSGQPAQKPGTEFEVVCANDIDSIRKRTYRPSVYVCVELIYTYTFRCQSKYLESRTKLHAGH